jgi:hypothetical protein
MKISVKAPMNSAMAFFQASIAISRLRARRIEGAYL